MLISSPQSSSGKKFRQKSGFLHDASHSQITSANSSFLAIFYP